jgi:hypothetical protein
MSMSKIGSAARKHKWLLIICIIVLLQVIVSTFAQADPLAAAIGNQNQLDTTGTVSGGNAYGTNTAQVNQASQTVTTPQADLDSSVGPRTMKLVVQKISENLQNLENSTTISSASDSILTMIVALLLAWSLVQAMFSGGFNKFIEAGIHTFLMWGIAYALINVGGIQGIAAFIDSIAAVLNGGNMSTLADALNTTIDKTFGALSSVLSMPSGNSNYKWTEDFDWAPLLVITVVQFLAKMVAGFLIILAFIIYACNIVLSFASIILAKAFAPVMIPFLLIPATAFIFNGWLKFFLTALLVKCVGAFFIKVCDAIINSIQSVAQSVYVAPDVDGLALVSANFVVYACLVGMAGLAAYLMTMVPSIANGLMSGSSVGSGFKGVGVITNGMAFRGGSRSLNSTGKATAKGARAVKNGAVKGANAAAAALGRLMKKGNGGGAGGAGSSGAGGRPGSSQSGGGRPPPTSPTSGGGSSGGGSGGQSGGASVGRAGNVMPMAGRGRGGRGGGSGGGGGAAGGAAAATRVKAGPSSSSSGTP